MSKLKHTDSANGQKSHSSSTAPKAILGQRCRKKLPTNFLVLVFPASCPRVRLNKNQFFYALSLPLSLSLPLTLSLLSSILYLLNFLYIITFLSIFLKFHCFKAVALINQQHKLFLKMSVEYK